MFDFNDAEPQMGPLGELIDDGTFARIKMKIRPGGVDGAVPADKGLLRAAKAPSDAKMLDCEFIVVSGPFARKKFWQNFTVSGGKLDDKGISIAWKISKSTFRAMIESATGLDPKDMSDAAKAKRQLNSLSQLNGIEFAARLMIEPATDYPGSRDQNRIANVVLKDEPQYEAAMRGDHVEPDPVNARPRKAAAVAVAYQGNAGGDPAWGGNTTAAPATTANAPAWLS